MDGSSKDGLEEMHLSEDWLKIDWNGEVEFISQHSWE